jgi:hypothetical protein
MFTHEHTRPATNQTILLARAGHAESSPESAPEQYRSSPDIQAQLNSLRDYLNTRYATQSVLNHAALLLTSTKIADLVEADRRKAIVQELLAGQRRWRLEPFFSILALGLEFALDREKVSAL